MCIITFMQKLTDSTYTSLTARLTWFIWLLLVILKQTLAINDADLTTGQMPFLQHNQQHQSTEGNSKHWPHQPSLIQLLTPKGRRRQTPSTLGLRCQYTEVTQTVRCRGENVGARPPWLMTSDSPTSSSWQEHQLHVDYNYFILITATAAAATTHLTALYLDNPGQLVTEKH